eukprot:CAMPEP_0183714012 /NCGR_PEP_ID=MMETSP0737-20130205/8721_1 /TAXON_ID=385413 /ORGANISM="Thalassiosira miniscula, Strain CCMP1093" /LENGTH=554 /DNA_ID=CAMNT_0025942917 /DNA_START=190 /DNA_END=1854 /DNA_ORIENTATION=-
MAFTPSSIPSLLCCRCRRSSTALPSSSSTPQQMDTTAPTSSIPVIQRDILVIGGGSAGLTAAKFAATFSKTVSLIESSKVGGDCTWTGCIPSKTLLSAAKKCWSWRCFNNQYGISNDGKEEDEMLRNMLQDVKKQIDDNRKLIYDKDDSPEALTKLGIDLVEGRASFVDAKTLDVMSSESDGMMTTSCRLEAKYGIVIATGAAPKDISKDIAGLDNIPYWTYENVWNEFFSSIEEDINMMVSQKRVIVVGGGPIGCELSQAINRLGCSVTLVASSRLLPREELEASEELQKVLEKEGIQVICNSRVISVTNTDTKGSEVQTIEAKLSSGEPIVGNHILVATGRVPNTKNMGLETLGIQIDSTSKGIKVNEKLETDIKGVYAAGDCTGDAQFTHYAGYQGAIAARNILLPLKDAGVLSEVPSTTFTDPEVASFGLTEQKAREEYGEESVSVAYRPLTGVDRAICEGVDAHGFLKIIYKSKNNQILGATIMAPSAGEMISELSVAKDAKLSFDALSRVMHSYPSYSIALQQMAAEVYYEKLKKNRGVYDLLKKAGL